MLFSLHIRSSAHFYTQAPSHFQPVSWYWIKYMEYCWERRICLPMNVILWAPYDPIYSVLFFYTTSYKKQYIYIETQKRSQWSGVLQLLEIPFSSSSKQTVTSYFPRKHEYSKHRHGQELWIKLEHFQRGWRVKSVQKGFTWTLSLVASKEAVGE